MSSEAKLPKSRATKNSATLPQRVYGKFLADGRLGRLERRYATHVFPGYSPWHVALVRLRVLAEWGIRFATERSPGALGGLRRARNRHQDRTALVLGNGPSVRRLNPHRVARAIAEDEIDVIAVNYFPLSDLYPKVSPRYLVLSDPVTQPNSVSPKTKKLYEVIEADRKLTLITPHHWHGRFPELTCGDNCLHFNDRSLQGWTRNIDPTRSRGYLSMTAYKALALSIHFDYRQTLLLGIDNSWFQTVFSDSGNEVLQPNNHFFQQLSEPIDITPMYPNGFTDFFYDLTLCFYDLRRCFGKERIIHMDPASLVDAFAKDPGPFAHLVETDQGTADA